MAKKYVLTNLFPVINYGIWSKNTIFLTLALFSMNMCNKEKKNCSETRRVLTVLCDYLQVLPEYQAQLAQQARGAEPRDPMSDIFARYDFIETSYHFFCQKIDLHLSDDPGSKQSCCKLRSVFYWPLFVILLVFTAYPHRSTYVGI